MADRPENLEECIHSVRFLETKDVETLSVLIGYGCDFCDKIGFPVVKKYIVYYPVFDYEVVK